MGFMTRALEAAVLASRPVPEWKKIFADNFGKGGNECVKKADEAFYALLEGGEHAFISAVVVENPAAFRPNKIKTFLTGKGELKNYPPAPPEAVALVREPVVTALAGIILGVAKKYEEIPGTFNDVFWNLNPQVRGYNRNTVQDAGAASSAMHGILNIAEGLDDKEAFREAANFFWDVFRSLPLGVLKHIRDFLPEEERRSVLVQAPNKPMPKPAKSVVARKEAVSPPASHLEKGGRNKASRYHKSDNGPVAVPTGFAALAAIRDSLPPGKSSNGVAVTTPETTTVQ